MLTLIGTIKTAGAYAVNGKDGSQKSLLSLNVVDEMGNTYSCQMWPDDAQQSQLIQVLQSSGLRYKRIQATIASYTARMRKFQDGSERPQANFIITNVQVSEQPAAAGAL